MPPLLLRPFHILTSKSSRLFYLQTLLLLTTSALLLLIATSAYIIFYNTYIPPLGISKPLFFHYSPPLPPSASTTFSPGDLVTNQKYTITLHLTLPSSPRNIDHGNFNCHVSISTPSGGRLMEARRPGIMTYTSPLLATLKTLFASPLLVTGVTRQEERLRIVIAEPVEFEGEPGGVRVSIDDGIAVYEARLEFVARFEGLRWVMYQWRGVSFVVFTGVFWGVEMVWAVGVWYWVSGWLRRKKEGEEEEEEEEEEGRQEEGEGEGEGEQPLRFGDVQRTFPTPSGRPPLRPSYPTPETTPAPEGEDWTPESGESRVGDDEEEDYNEEYERLVEAGTSRITDSGLGTTMSESTGRNRSQSGTRRRRG
ncbi:hypothetical protein K440DRAFT_416784 [Wilcoxina mikolae CBS 423.85]|nr:hypothetical protein K440DRAFT_416784 [Wilcoxina mikolae CBS 423.85]